MKYPISILKQVLDYRGDENYSFEILGLANSTIPNTFSFLDDKQYVTGVNDNLNVTGLVVTNDLAPNVNDRLFKVICDDPRHVFYSLYNLLTQRNYSTFESIVNPSAEISERSYVSPLNVIIEANVKIEPQVTILPDVIIRSNTIIRAGAVVGSEGFEVKRTKTKLLPVFHDGRVIIESEVEVGANCTIDKGIYGKDTVIGWGTKLDNQVHIAHNVSIGKNCLLIASCCILGSVIIGDDVWIGPKVMVINGCKIGNRSEITLGSIVTKDVPPDTRIIGKVALSKLMTY